MDQWLILTLIIILVLGVCIGTIIIFCIWRKSRRRNYIPLEERRSLRDSEINRIAKKAVSSEKLDPETSLILTSLEVSKSEKKKQVEKIRGKKLQKEIEEIELDGRMYVRSTRFENSIFYPEIGSRKGKYYFLVEEKAPKKTKFLLSMIPIGSTFFNVVNNDTKINLLQKLILKIQHPFILSVVFAEFRKDKNCFAIFREFFPKGTLRDLIHESVPEDFYKLKYTQVSGSPLQEKKIRLFGRQILEGIDYLTYQGFPCYHVHAGNIIIDNGVCRLTEIENDFFGILPQSHLIMCHLIGKIDPSVIAFTYVLYEMAVGYPLDSPDLDDIPSRTNQKVVKILKNIFHPTSTPETLHTIVKDPFFAEIKLYIEWETKPIDLSKKEKLLVNKLMQNALEILKNPSLGKINSSQTLATSVPKKTKKKSKDNSSSVSSSVASSVPQASSLSSSSFIPPSSTPSVPPPPPTENVPPMTEGRSSLLDSIRNPDNMKKLKKVPKK